MRRFAVALSLGSLLLAACSSTETDERPATGDAGATTTSPPPESSTPPSGKEEATEEPETAEPTQLPRLSGNDLDVRTAMQTVDFLAEEIGPRPGHTDAYFRAARWVERRFTEEGWEVERQRFPSPAGVSAGVPVDGGPSVNLMATRGDLEPGEPWLLVGAHLDTVPQAPGAEDNASGIGVLLTLAEAIAERRTRLPVMLVAFGSEEPRGAPTDNHYGSKFFVEQMTGQQRRSLRAMVSLDRVGVGGVVPVQTITEPNGVSRALEQAAERSGVPTVRETFETSSDHQSFSDAGMPAARLGSTPYFGYHSPQDVPSVINRDQLARTARIMAAWLR